MCYVHLEEDAIAQRGRELSAKEWIQLGEQAIEAGTLSLTITGGEPLVRPDFPEIYTALTDMGFWISLQTNLSLLDGKLLDLIASRPPTRIKATIYGATEETYEKVCGVKDGLRRVKRGIENVLAAQIPLVLVSTVIRENEAELDAIHRLAAEYGLPLQHTHNVMNSRRNDQSADILASRILYEDLSEEERCDLHIKPHQKVMSPLDICGNYQNGGYWVLWNGHLSLCSHMDMKYEPLKTSIGQCFDEMLEDLDRQYPRGCCSGCEANTYCRTCPAVLYAEGSKLGEGKCKTAQRMKQDAEKISN